VLRTKVSVFVELQKKSEQIQRQAERLRQIETSEFRRRLLETNDRLETETKRNRFFILSVDLLASAGFDGYFKQLSPSWQQTLGYSKAELKRPPFLDLVPPADRAATAAQLEKLKRGSFIQYFENRCQCKDGAYSWLGWTAAPFMEERLLYIFAR